MRLLTLSGSLRPDSSNSAFLRAAARLAPAGWEITGFEGMDALPHFSPERDAAEAPPAVAALREALRAADAVLICSPEYAHGIPGSFKNLLDWVVGSGELVEKPVGILTGSPSADGGAFAHRQLMEVLTVMNARVVAEASFPIPNIRSKVQSGGVADADLAERLRSGLDALQTAASGAAR